MPNIQRKKRKTQKVHTIPKDQSDTEQRTRIQSSQKASHRTVPKIQRKKTKTQKVHTIPKDQSDSEQRTRIQEQSKSQSQNSA